MTDTKEMIRRLAMLLDAALPLLEREATHERMQEDGKAMRQITHQQRAEAARDLIEEADAWLAEQ